MSSENSQFPTGFDPRKDHWIFSSYYKYTFTFQSLEHPTWMMSYGGDRDQIYRYDVGATATTWDEATEHTCGESEIQDALDGNHEFVYLYEVRQDV